MTKTRDHSLEIEAQLAAAHEFFDNGDFDAARKVLEPLLAIDNGAAIRMNCSHFNEGETEEEIDRIYVDGMIKAAECGDLHALYIVGSFYDLGEYDAIPRDTTKASKIFKEAADKGHEHCMWIHACDLLWGRSSFPQSIENGKEYLEKAIESGSAEACMTKAKFLIGGEFGFQKDRASADKLRALAMEFDDTTFDPWA